MELQKALTSIQKEILTFLEVDIEFRHIGSSALQIKGKKDIDLEVLVDKKDFEYAQQKLSQVYEGATKIIDSFWNKFETNVSEWDVDILLSTSDHEETIRNKLFFEHLKNNIEVRNQYSELKNKYNLYGAETYLAAKKEFFDKVVKSII